MSLSTASKRVLPALLALACLGADDGRPAPKFAGRSIPDPARQREPWTPPPTKLPRFLVTATAALFADGVADPRGCEYREVEVEVGGGILVKTRGFVLPPRPDVAGRFVIGWNGVIYPATSVGAAADLDRDVQTMAESLQSERDAPGRERMVVIRRGGQFIRGGPPPVPARGWPLRLCLLLRLGRADQAEELFAAATTWKPGARGRDLTDYHTTYLTMAQEWASGVYTWLVEAHALHEDVVALDAAVRLSAFVASVDRRAEEMGFLRERPRNTDQPPSYLTMLPQLPELLADHRRRAAEPPRGPIPPAGGDAAARVAALIRDLDEISEVGGVMNGTAVPANSPLVKQLTAEGDAAVEPLLAALESDVRLTRTVSDDRRMIHPVVVAEVAALFDILQTSQFQQARMSLQWSDLAARRELARSIRDDWSKNRAIPPLERWYRTLRDDAAGRDRWMEAAANIIYPGEWPGRAANGHIFVPGMPKGSRMKGEELRARRDPSVSDLMARRTLAIASGGNVNSHPNIELDRACEMGRMLNRWDPKAALPILRTLMARCREDIDAKRQSGNAHQQSLGRYIAEFALVRVGAGDRAALDEYAAWIRDCTPQELEHSSITCFEPMWTHPDHPSIRGAARKMFAGPQSPWRPYLGSKVGRATFLFHDGRLCSSPMVRLPEFRALLVAAMADRTVVGTVSHNGQGMVSYRFENGSAGELTPKADLEGFEQGVERSFRAGDDVARGVSAIEGVPRIELYWPEDRRDQAIQDIGEFLESYGHCFAAETPEAQADTPFLERNRARLAFPILDRPATPDDVRAGRGIFSLEGEGEARRVQVPALPLRARRIASRNVPSAEANPGAAARGEDDREGWIWQAEEVLKGGRWERFFGFVGRHGVARLSADEVELSPGRFTQPWGRLRGDLDARIEPPEPRPAGFEVGRPIHAVVRLRNRRGHDGIAPMAFLRRGADGGPSLRRGVTIIASYTAPQPAGAVPGQGRIFGQIVVAAEELKPKRSDHFEPPVGARPLAAFESFEAMRIDLRDWFDLSRPGSYRVRVLFSADAGVGEGASNDWYFTVGKEGGAVP